MSRKLTDQERTQLKVQLGPVYNILAELLDLEATDPQEHAETRQSSRTERGGVAHHMRQEQEWQRRCLHRGPYHFQITMDNEGDTAANTIRVNVCVCNHRKLAARSAELTLDWWLMSDAAGTTFAGSSPDGNIAAGSQGTMIGYTAGDLSGMVRSKAGSAKFEMDLTHSATGTWYLMFRTADGLSYVSDAITFA